MRNPLLAGSDAGYWPTIKYFIIAFTLIVIHLSIGINDNIPMILMLLIGIVLFFFAVLYPWKNATYYGIMAGIFVLLFILLLKAGIGILVKMEAAGKLHVHGAEDIAMTAGFVLISGVIAGIIGALRYHNYGSR